MVGLDAAGKTTILYKLKLGEGKYYWQQQDWDWIGRVGLVFGLQSMNGTERNECRRVLPFLSRFRPRFPRFIFIRHTFVISHNSDS